jgi:hypothetical protein
MNIQFANNRRGTSLVEVLVTMSVLVVGIMVMIQMFPSGFSVIKTAEQKTVASRLAQAEISRWSSRAANLPDAFLPVVFDPAGNYQVIDNYQMSKRGAQLASFVSDGVGGWIRGNVLNLRLVMGETVAFSEASFFETTGGTTFGSRYMLAYGPVDTYHYEDSANAGVMLLKNFAVRSQDMRRLPEDVAPSAGNQYSIDYGTSGNPTFNIAFIPNTTTHARIYYITYSYWANNGTFNQMVTKVNQEIVVPTGYDGSWIPISIIDIPAGYTFSELVPFTEKVCRGYRLLQGAETWSDDAYEFTLSDPLLGLLAFNPKARFEGNGSAKVDYLVYDPRIMTEDVVVPQASTSRIAIKLPLRFLLDSRSGSSVSDGMSTQNPDEPTFEGLMRQAGASTGGDPIPQLGAQATGTADLLINGAIMVIDVSTGLLVDPESVDFGQGIVYINSSSDLRKRTDAAATITGAAMSGRRIRIYYRASGDWAVQVTKAYSRYSRSYTGAVNHSQFAQDNVLTRRLYFAKLYAGQTVLVDYTYGGSEQNKVAGESYRISDDYATNGLCYIDLRQVPDRIYSVIGGSVRARIMWRDSFNWRLADSESLILRPADSQ